MGLPNNSSQLQPPEKDPNDKSVLVVHNDQQNPPLSQGPQNQLSPVMEKYFVIFCDASVSRESFLNTNNDKKISYAFCSCILYIVHRCQLNDQLTASLVSTCSKISTPNQDIIKAECTAPLLGLKRIAFFIKLYNIPHQNVLCFSDNIPFLYLLRNYHKNFTTYKSFYLRVIKQILGSGIPAQNFYYVQSLLNIADKLTRLSSMESSNINEILGNYQNGLFDLNSKIFGAFNFQKYFDENQKKTPGPRLSNSRRVRTR